MAAPIGAAIYSPIRPLRKRLQQIGPKRLARLERVILRTFPLHRDAVPCDGCPLRGSSHGPHLWPRTGSAARCMAQVSRRPSLGCEKASTHPHTLSVSRVRRQASGGCISQCAEQGAAGPRGCPLESLHRPPAELPTQTEHSAVGTQEHDPARLDRPPYPVQPGTALVRAVRPGALWPCARFAPSHASSCNTPWSTVVGRSISAPALFGTACP